MNNKRKFICSRPGVWEVFENDRYLGEVYKTQKGDWKITFGYYKSGYAFTTFKEARDAARVS